MADEKQPGPAAPVKDKGPMVSIYNKGGRTFRTSAGELKPEKSLALPADEAKKLLGYKNLIETGKMSAKDSRTRADLRAENAALKAERDALKSQLPPAAPPAPPKGK